MRKILIFVLLWLVSVQISGNARLLKKVFVAGGVMHTEGKEVVGSFYITKFEITNAEYAVFLNKKRIGADGIFNEVKIINVNSSDLQVEFKKNRWAPKPGKKYYPMVMVNYYGAMEYCNWVKGKLPTETEWAYAALGGNKSKNYTFAGGNILAGVGWYQGNSGGHSHQVGKKKPNELGIYDMSGNAWEWCLNDSLKSMKEFCVHKGGSWYAGEQPASIHSHYGNTPLHFSNSVGFRVVFGL